MTAPHGHEPRNPHPLTGWDIIEQAGELARRGEEFALATVVWRQGPSSGQAGSRAIVTSEGQLFGWIGGACAEPVVIREAQRAIRRREPSLILLGTPEQFGGGVPEGMVVVPISCQSEGALEVFIEPATPIPQLVIVGRSPMATTLGDLARALGWRAEVLDGPDFSAADIDSRSIVVVATQGHGDEEAVEQAVSAYPAFVGLVASRKRAQGVLGYLADRGVPQHLLDRVHAPVGLDLGHTSHREIAAAILAELVRERAAGRLLPGAPSTPTASVATGTGEAVGSTTHDHAGHDHHAGPDRAGAPSDAVDPVCGMTVRADASSRPVELGGVTYYFCCVGCRDAFVADPSAYVSAGSTLHQEA